MFVVERKIYDAADMLADIALIRLVVFKVLVAFKLELKVVKIDDVPLNEVEINVEVVDVNEVDFVSVVETKPLLTNVVVATKVKIEEPVVISVAFFVNGFVVTLVEVYFVVKTLANVAVENKVVDEELVECIKDEEVADDVILLVNIKIDSVGDEISIEDIEAVR